MRPEVLAHAMGNALPDARYVELAGPFSAAMRDAGCTTIERAAMWCAQIGHESGGLRWLEELASGQAYEGRKDLGNVQPGDGPRFKGRGPIQITGRDNYASCSRWAYGRGLVPAPSFFVDNPQALASVQYGFVGTVWYWTVARPGINAAADRRDLDAVTRLINGGLNGLADRRQRYTRCLAIGAALLDSPPSTPGDWFAMASKDDLRAVVLDVLRPYLDPASPTAIARREDVGWARSQVLTALGVADPATAPAALPDDQLTARQPARRNDVVVGVQQIGERLAKLEARLAAAGGGNGAVDLDALADAVADRLFARVIEHGAA